jgi:interferon gamma-inducible protein 30
MNRKIILTLFIVVSLLSSILNKNPPTVIDFYMESLCPYCRQFAITNIKALLATEGHEELADVNFIPYGNASEKKTGDQYVFTCQHGDKECRGNLIETCAINVMEKSDANSFIVCLEENYSGNFDSTAAQCLVDSADKKAKLDSCLNSPQANTLQHNMAEKTKNLQPPHKWVPWVVVDGKYDDDATSSENLVAYLCSKRTDSKELKACNKQQLVEKYLSFLEEEFYCMRD